MSVLLFDLDHFKTINDRFGHAAGDAVLRETARRVASIVRAQDTFGRFGGEEFALLLPCTNLDEAMLAQGARCDRQRAGRCRGSACR